MNNKQKWYFLERGGGTGDDFGQLSAFLLIFQRRFSAQTVASHVGARPQRSAAEDLLLWLGALTRLWSSYHPTYGFVRMREAFSLCQLGRLLTPVRVRRREQLHKRDSGQACINSPLRGASSCTFPLSPTSSFSWLTHTRLYRTLRTPCRF